MFKFKSRLEPFRERWAFATETQRDHLKLLAGVLVLGVLAAIGYYWGRPQLRRIERDQALAQAKEFSARKDYRNALLALHRAVEKNTNDIAAWQQVADFLGDIGSPEVLVARRNLVLLAPGDISLRLGFVLDALRFGDVDGARDVFGAVHDAAREEVAFFRMAAAIAYATGQMAEFEASLEQLVRRAPDDHEAAMDLALLRLWGADAARAGAAQAVLTGLVQYPAVRVRAAVELLKYTARTGTRAEARALVAFLHSQFIGRPAPGLTENAAGALAEPPGWGALVEAIKRDAGGTAQNAAVTARWLGALGLGREALVWLDGVTDRVRRSPLVGAAALDLALALDDAPRLRPLLLEGAWGRAAVETVDLAFATRWQQRLGRAANAQNTWADAVASTADSLPGLRVLTRLAMAWSDPAGAEVAMQAVVNRFVAERWAWEALKLEYARRHETAKLLELYSKWTVAQPENRPVAQDWVMLSLLMGQPSAAVHARAKQARQAAPEDAMAVLGYAVSLRAQQRRGEALAALENLPQAERRRTHVALWQGVLLVEMERLDEARLALAGVDPAQLLPEEEKLRREAVQRAAPASQKRIPPAPKRP